MIILLDLLCHSPLLNVFQNIKSKKERKKKRKNERNKKTNHISTSCKQSHNSFISTSKMYLYE